MKSTLLSRAEVRQLKSEIRRESSASAAERLLFDSVQKGHDKLALHRYLVLHKIDSIRCGPYEGYCQQIAKNLPNAALQRILAHMSWLG